MEPQIENNLNYTLWAMNKDNIMSVANLKNTSLTILVLTAPSSELEVFSVTLKIQMSVQRF